MLAFERRQLLAILGSFAAEGGPDLAPRAGEVDFVGTYAKLGESARAIARLGMRAALWIVALAPLWLSKRAASMAALPLEQRQELLEQLLDHRVYAVREAAFFLKLCACLALFASDELRARSGYDAPPEALVSLARGKR